MPVPLAAERYGLKANHAGMARCPFHDDHTPSLKLNEDYFYCFGCGAGGTLEQRNRSVERLMANGKMDQLEERLTRLIQEENASEYQIEEES